MRSPMSSSNSVGKGPRPTRVVYAFTIPTTSVICRGPRPDPQQAFPETVLEEVT